MFSKTYSPSQQASAVIKRSWNTRNRICHQAQVFSLHQPCKHPDINQFQQLKQHLCKDVLVNGQWPETVQTPANEDAINEVVR